MRPSVFGSDDDVVDGHGCPLYIPSRSITSAIIDLL